MYIYSKLTGFIANNASGASPQSAAPPPDLTKKAISLQVSFFNVAPLFKKFRDVLSNVNSTYSARQTVNAQFVGADPRNNFRLERTFLAVQQLANGQWKTVHSSTTFECVRVSTVLATSTVTLNWTIVSAIILTFTASFTQSHCYFMFPLMNFMNTKFLGLTNQDELILLQIFRELKSNQNDHLETAEETPSQSRWGFRLEDPGNFSGWRLA
ncbi:hypothetical protein M422DRAFT_248471 [Sphaerobolus stellatus SS14]|uniref:Neutral/alkaline non-lysosomal ceramidase C-terminal domain-containing protein n=1 Tax=Sphaerobolus stellatus (strain SS14) TaxID=990650 RepID=A0A0C9VVX6_SPHS4|nr:hypothetical protein M422DRAFT_248471 [Sphaerobolus stellatus SS14]